MAELLGNEPRSDECEKTKEVVLNDVTNTGVMGALVGGFALSSIQAGHFDPVASWVDDACYLLLVLAVHACTCSALTSALVYRFVNAMNDEAVPAWAKANRLMLMMPIMKFAMGTASYIISVIGLSWTALGDVPASRTMALAIGVGSMSTVLMTVAMLNMPAPPHEAKVYLTLTTPKE